MGAEGGNSPAWGPERRKVPMYYRARGITEARAKELNDRVRALREAGLSYAAIAGVMAVYEGILVGGGHEVRGWCRRLGLPKNPNKARAPRAVVV
jgi:hypothetical protein